MSNLILNVEILGEFKKLTQATQGAQGSLNSLNKRASAISKSMNRAFAAIGVGLSFRLLTRELEQATMAAVEDRKSQELLALAMQNTADATLDQVAAAEKSILRLSMQAGVADDELRPAFQKLFLATKDVNKSQDLLAIALDASAATGKGLDVVSQAMAKSLAGSDTALLKLIPSLKGSKTPIEDLATAFAGASEKAANLDPYQRMQVIFGEIQEKIGTALLPVLDDFAKWMSSPPGQRQLKEISDAAADILKNLAATARWAVNNKDWLVPLIGGVAALSAAANAVAGITTAINTARAAMLLFNAATLLNPLVLAAGSVAAILSIPGSAPVSSAPSQVRDNSGQIIPKVNNAPLTKPQPNSSNTGFDFSGKGNVNITINTPKVSAQDITNIVNKATKTGYTGQLTSNRVQ